MSIRSPRNLHEIWELFEPLLPPSGEVRDFAKLCYFMGGRDYSRLLQNGHSCLHEAEDFLAASELFEHLLGSSDDA